MMQKMRDPRTLKWGLWAVLILVIPSFVLFYGFGDSGGSGGPVGLQSFGTVYGEHGRHELGQQEIQAAREELRDRYLWSYVMTRNQFPDQAQMAMIETGLPNRRVAEHAVSMIALNELAEDSDLIVTNEQVNQRLREEGWTREAFEGRLRQMRMSEEEFLRMMRFQERTQRTEALVSSAAKVSLLELWLEYKLREDSLTATFIRVPARDLEADLEVTEEEILAHYEANPDSYMKPQERVYRYVAFPPPELSESFDVSDEEVEEAYEALEPGNDPTLTVIAGRVFRIARGSEDEREALEAALPLLAEGTNLEEALADDFAGTIEDRSVDFATDADQIAEELGGEVLAAMEDLGQGQSSEILEVGDSLFVVQLAEVERVKAPLDQIRPLVQARVRSQKEAQEEEIRDEIIRETMVGMMDVRRTRTSLDAIARDLNLTVETSSPVRSSSNFISGVGNLFEYADILRDMREDELSPVLRADGTDNLVVLEVSEVIPAAVRPLEDVRTQVESAVRRQKAAELAEEIAQEAAERIRGGESMTEVAEDLGLESVTTGTAFTRMSPPQQLAMARESIANRTLQMAEGEVIVLRSGVQDFVDGYVAFRLDTKEEPSREQFIEDMASLETQLQQAKGEMFVDEFRRDALRQLRYEFDELYINEGQERPRRRSRRSS